MKAKANRVHALLYILAATILFTWAAWLVILPLDPDLIVMAGILIWCGLMLLSVPVADNWSVIKVWLRGGKHYMEWRK